MDEPASSDTENEASREAEIRFLAEALRQTPRAIRRMYPCRGLPWIASGETEMVPPAEARRPLPRPTLGSLARGGVCSETPCSRLESRGEVEEGSVVAGEGPTAYLLALF